MQGESKQVLVFTSFIQLILELNGVMSKEEDILEAPKILEESRVSMMRYYRDKDGVYYYVEKPNRKVCDDRIVGPEKSSTNKASSSDVGVLFAVARDYFDEFFCWENHGR